MDCDHPMAADTTVASLTLEASVEPEPSYTGEFLRRGVRKPSIDLLGVLDAAPPLKTPVTACVFSTGVERFVHEHTPEDFPRVTTRGHFDTCRLRMTPVTPDGRAGGLLGLSKRRYITSGHTETDYETTGELPWTEDGDSPDEALVFVHGWLADRAAALGRMSLMRYGLEKNGYRHPVVGFTWDSRQPAAEWRTGKTLARWNGPKLAEFVGDFKEEHPDTRLRLLSNSLGDRVLFSALETLEDDGHSRPLESATVLGGSVDRNTVASGGRYADAVRNQVGDLYNYWTPHDDTVSRWLPLLERGEALGTGAPEDRPDNLHDRGVMYVPDHFSLYLPGRGCVHEVVRDFGVDVETDDEVTDEFEAFEDTGRIPISDSG